MANKTILSEASAIVFRRAIVVCMILLILIISLSACSGSSTTSEPDTNPQPRGPIEAVWIEPQLDGDTVSIPVSDVDDNWNIHFGLATSAGEFNYMAYQLNNETYVRANVCPPCRSIGYSLDDTNLVCDRCATTFEAETGDGISGACVDFPKAEAPYEIEDGFIVMQGADLIAAYQNTLKPGWP
jgi:hypothetical protein